MFVSLVSYKQLVKKENFKMGLRILVTTLMLAIMYGFGAIGYMAIVSGATFSDYQNDIIVGILALVISIVMYGHRIKHSLAKKMNVSVRGNSIIVGLKFFAASAVVDFSLMLPVVVATVLHYSLMHPIVVATFLDEIQVRILSVTSYQFSSEQLSKQPLGELLRSMAFDINAIFIIFSIVILLAVIFLVPGRAANFIFERSRSNAVS